MKTDTWKDAAVTHIIEVEDKVQLADILESAIQGFNEDLKPH